MKKLIIATLVFVTISITANCQNEKADDLKHLFELMQSEKTMDQTMDNMINVMQQQMSSQIQGENADKKADEMFKYIMTEAKAMAKKLIDEDLVTIYNNHFTHDEIKGLIVFYESPVGQKMINETPAISKEMMEAMMTKHMPEFQTKIMAKTQEMQEQN